MAKSKKALQEENLQGVAPVETQEATSSEAAAGSAAEETGDLAPEPLHLVVLAHPGTEGMMRRIWEKFYDLPFRVIPFQEHDSLISVLEDVMAMDDVDRVFAVVPANLVPLAPVRWSDLQLPRVDCLKPDNFLYWGRVPVCFDKEQLVDNLPECDDLEDESFVRAYVKTFYAGRPEQVSHSFGNYFTKVLRGTPCESIVIEGLMHKRFLYANAIGWTAIADLIQKALLG